MTSPNSKPVTLRFLAPTVVAPENFNVAVLVDTNTARYVPVWMGEEDAIRLADRYDHTGATRPDTHDLLMDLINTRGGLRSLTITDVNEGAFFVTIKTNAGDDLDGRMSDALVLSLLSGIEITISEELLSQVGVPASNEDIEEYFGIEVDFKDPTVQGQEGTTQSTTGNVDNAESAAEFSEWMQSHGIDKALFDVELETDFDGDDESGADDEGNDPNGRRDR